MQEREAALDVGHRGRQVALRVVAELLARADRLLEPRCGRLERTVKLSSRGASGTFTGTNTVVTGTKVSEAPMSGSWRCGTVYAF